LVPVEQLGIHKLDLSARKQQAKGTAEIKDEEVNSFCRLSGHIIVWLIHKYLRHPVEPPLISMRAFHHGTEINYEKREILDFFLFPRTGAMRKEKDMSRFSLVWLVSQC
jgi:hypothetical protein